MTTQEPIQTTLSSAMPADLDPSDQVFNTISAICWSLVTPVALVTNTFTLLVVYRSAVTDDINHIFIVTINILILVSCVCFALPATISATSGGVWILGEFLCTAQSLLVVYLHCACALVLLSSSIERYVFLIHPLRYPRLVTVTRARRLVICILVFPFLNVPLTGILSNWQAVYTPSCHVCAPYSEPQLKKALFVSFFILLSIVPSVVAYFVHTALLLTARQHLRRIIAGIPRSVTETPSSSTADDGAVPRHSCQQMEACDRKIQVNKWQFILLTIFTPVAIGVYLILDLALFGYNIPQYLVLLGNLSIFISPTLVGLKSLLTSNALKKSARQFFSCCCCQRGD